MRNWHILSMDSDAALRGQVCDYLSRHGFQVSTAHTQRDLWRKLDQISFDLLLLGPDAHGETDLDLLRQLRSASDLPMIVSNAGEHESDRILALELGADDHLRRPFNPRELLARIRGFQRRSRGSYGEPHQGTTLRFAGWAFSPQRNLLLCPQGKAHHLTASERRLLAVFLKSPGRILSRERLLRLVTEDGTSRDRNIDMMVWRLRRKLDPLLIRTERHEGYAFTASVLISDDASDECTTIIAEN